MPLTKSLLYSAVSLGLAVLASRGAFAQLPSPLNPEPARQAAEHQEKLHEVSSDKAAIAARIVARWENSARTSGKWDEHFSADLFVALMKLPPESLLAVGQAATFEAFLSVLATGHEPTPKPQPDAAESSLPAALGQPGDDLVFTPLPPCRIVDTRVAGGAIPANTRRPFDVDGTNLSAQGGSSSGCGLPYAVVRAAAMTITVTQPNRAGYLKAWAYDAAEPNASVLNFAPGQTIANTTIVPVLPGSGADFNIASDEADAQVVIDVVGYFAAPQSTAVNSEHVYQTVDAYPVSNGDAKATCPSGTGVTGGGFYLSGGGPGTQVFASWPGANNDWFVAYTNPTQTDGTLTIYAVCTRIPGR